MPAGNHHFNSLNPLQLLAYLAKWLGLASLVALASGSASALLLHGLAWVGQCREQHLWLIACLPLAGFAVAWLYLNFGQQVEAGNNLLIDEIHDPKKVIPLRMAPLVLIATLISHLFGASVGREGTAVQMGGALADQLTQAFRLNSADRRLLLMAGIAAGFASVFGTPLAGALFALEVLAVGRLQHDALFATTVAAILANQVAHLWGVQHELYQVNALIPAWGWASLAATLAAGACFGLIGFIFARGSHLLSQKMQQHIGYSPLRPLLGGSVFIAVIVATSGYAYLGLGLSGISASFNQPVATWDFGAKLLATLGCIGSGFKGGEVTPLFYIGASLGNALAPLLHLPYGLLAAMGFVAVFAGAANTPIACCLMSLELFGNEVGLYASLACVVSYLFSGHSGIYRAQRVLQNKH